MTNKCTVIMYHYVRDLKKSKFPQIKALETELFIEQIEYLRKHYNVITMEELIACFDNNVSLPPKSLLLTFDDGYIDHYLNVFPVLHRYKLQGTFFIPGKAISENRMLDVNKIHFLLASVEDKTKILNDIKLFLNQYKNEYEIESYEYYFKNIAKSSRFDPPEIIFIKRILQVELPETLRQIILNHLFEKYVSINEEEFSTELYLSKNHILDMHAHNMHIGSHGYDHYWWDRLSQPALEREIGLSQQFLQDLNISMNTWTACYPYNAYSELATKILIEKGCKAAFAGNVRVASIEAKNRFFIPRLDTNDIPKSRDATPNEWFNQA
ncbi:MAG: polysaccharide deacetylase family protein [Proteobacteria bacterium]|nr:polysaccharide deacetylase family protein [Pseudomonadota bacterium]